MSVPYWKSHETEDDSVKHEPARPVDEQHALPVNIYFTPTGSSEAEAASSLNPVPVKIMADVQWQYIQAKIPAPIAVDNTTVTLIVPANSRRRSVLITQVTGAQLVYLHVDSRVSATRYGTVLTAAVGSSATFYCKNAIYGLAASAAQTVGIWEEEYVYAGA